MVFGAYPEYLIGRPLGGLGGVVGEGAIAEDGLCLFLHPRLELFGEVGVLECEDAGGEQAGIFGSGGADCERSHGDTAWHLDDGQE